MLLPSHGTTCDGRSMKGMGFSVESAKYCLLLACFQILVFLTIGQGAQGAKAFQTANRTDSLSSETEGESEVSFGQIFFKALKRGLGGGSAGALAGLAQVLSLMWLRTITSYQYRYGTSFSQALTILLKEGGIRRLYQGVQFALIQAPLARFVSTASNDTVQFLLARLSWTATWGPERTTAVASFVVGFWRILMMRASYLFMLWFRE